MNSLPSDIKSNSLGVIRHLTITLDKKSSWERNQVPVKTVLVVDDNPAIRNNLCELFTREGDFEVCAEAENGREAIEKA